MLFRSFYPWPGLVRSGLRAFLSASFLKGQPFNISGELEILKNSIQPGKKKKSIFLCYQHKQKFCFIYAEALTDVVTMWIAYSEK